MGCNGEEPMPESTLPMGHWEQQLTTNPLVKRASFRRAAYQQG